VFEGLTNNFIFVGVIVFTVVMQFIFVEFGGVFFSTKPLSFWQWVSCIGLGFSIIPLGTAHESTFFSKKQDPNEHIPDNILSLSLFL
jgi:hypothetical protein